MIPKMTCPICDLDGGRHRLSCPRFDAYVAHVPAERRDAKLELRERRESQPRATAEEATETLGARLRRSLGRRWSAPHDDAE